MNNAAKMNRMGVSRKDQQRLLYIERKWRKCGKWGEWETIQFEPGRAGSGWAALFTTAHKNRVFSVLDRMDFSGARHLAVSSLSGIRPTWHEMQRIKNELAGETATAVEVYPPAAEVVDDANMFHLWVLPGPLPFTIYRPEEHDQG